MALTDEEMKTRWVFEQDDGRISIVIPVDRNSTLDEIKSKAVPDGKTAHAITVDDVPTDRSFRDAWTYTP